MQNWIGIAIWIIMGAAIGLMMRAAISRPEEQPGHAQVIMALGAFASVIGGMLGVGIFHLWEPLALSVGGIALVPGALWCLVGLFMGRGRADAREEGEGHAA